MELEHGGFDRHGDGVQGVDDGVDQGWPYCLEQVANARSPIRALPGSVLAPAGGSAGGSTSGVSHK
jgi:hypothetical protein